MLKHEAAGGVGTVGGGLPVGVGAGSRIPLRIGVAFHGDGVGQFTEFAGERAEQFDAVGADFRAAAVEESAGGGFGQLDAKPFVGDGHVDIVFELFEIGNFANRFFELLFDFVHVVFGDDEIFPGAVHVAADFFGGASGVAEVTADRFLNFFAGAKEPEDDEERHHGGDEVSVSDFPRAAVVAAVAAFFLDDDDGFRVGHGGRRSIWLCGRSSCRFSAATAAFNVFFEILKAGANVAWNRATAKFDGDRRRNTLHESDHGDAKNVVVGVLVFSAFGHARGYGADEAVAEQNAEKRANERGGDFMADSSGGPPMAPMVMTTPSTAATMPSPGSESAMVESAAMGWPAS